MRLNFLSQRRVNRTSDELFFPVDRGPKTYVPQERTSSTAPAVERRREDRQPYPCLQRLAERAPRQAIQHEINDDSFASVRCHDISRAGISFWTQRVPESGEVLIDLGSDHDCLRVVAEVRHTTELSCLDRSLYLVGCRIVGRC